MAPARVFLPNRTESPGITSMRSRSSVGRRSKLISSAVASLTRTPSRNTLTPCGTPVTEVPWNPRKERSGWCALPCSSARDNPGTWPASDSGKLERADRRASAASIACTLAGTLEGDRGTCGSRPTTTISSDASVVAGCPASGGLEGAGRAASCARALSSSPVISTNAATLDRTNAGRPMPGPPSRRASSELSRFAVSSGSRLSRRCYLSEHLVEGGIECLRIVEHQPMRHAGDRPPLNPGQMRGGHRAVFAFRVDGELGPLERRQRFLRAKVPHFSAQHRKRGHIQLRCRGENAAPGLG